MAKDKADKNCLSCGLAFGKTTGKKEAAVKCMICSLWCHKSCAGVSDEYLKILEEQLKATGVAYWACRSCAAYNRLVSNRFQEIERRMDQQEGRTKENEETIKRNEERTEEVDKKVERLALEVEKLKKNSTENWMEEMREREMRRENIIVYGVEEADEEERDGRVRAESDLKKLDLVFMAARANIPTKDAVNFCRRVGEKGEEPRPLVVGFHEEATRKKVLKGAKNLRNSQQSHVTIAPDLTKLQRKAEDDLKIEAAEKNKQLTTEDRAKNLQGLVVGPRGAKRLIKGVNRFPSLNSGRQPASQTQPQKRKADRNSPDSRKRGKQALIEKVRAERQQELARTGIPLLPSTPLLPQIRDSEEEEAKEEEEENMDNEEQRGMGPEAL